MNEDWKGCSFLHTQIFDRGTMSFFVNSTAPINSEELVKLFADPFTPELIASIEAEYESSNS